MSASRDKDKPVPPSARSSITVRIANNDGMTATSRRPALPLPLPGNEPCSDKRLPSLQRPNVRPHHVLVRLPPPHYLRLALAHGTTAGPTVIPSSPGGDKPFVLSLSKHLEGWRGISA